MEIFSSLYGSTSYDIKFLGSPQYALVSQHLGIVRNYYLLLLDSATTLHKFVWGEIQFMI